MPFPCCWVYMLRCSGDRLYTGFTTDILLRYGKHLRGVSGSKFTRSFRPQGLAQCWRVFGGEGEARRTEAAIKKLDRRSKDALIAAPQTIRDLLRPMLGCDISVYAFDPVLVERELRRIGEGGARDSGEPFAEFPRQDILA